MFDTLLAHDFVTTLIFSGFSVFRRIRHLLNYEKQLKVPCREPFCVFGHLDQQKICGLIENSTRMNP